MIREDKDLSLLKKATACLRDLCPEDVLETWFEMPRNVMLVEDGDVGLATFEYPGLYNVHWYFESRGRKAIETARRMIGHMFDNHGAQAVRGLVRVDLKASRWATRQVGLKSYGIVSGPSGECELFCMTKDEYKGMNNG